MDSTNNLSSLSFDWKQKWNCFRDHLYCIKMNVFSIRVGRKLQHLKWYLCFMCIYSWQFPFSYCLVIVPVKSEVAHYKRTQCKPAVIQKDIKSRWDWKLHVPSGIQSESLQSHRNWFSQALSLLIQMPGFLTCVWNLDPSNFRFIQITSALY